MKRFSESGKSGDFSSTAPLYATVIYQPSTIQAGKEICSIRCKHICKASSSGYLSSLGNKKSSVQASVEAFELQYFNFQEQCKVNIGNLRLDD